MLRIQNLKVPLDYTAESMTALLAKKLKLMPKQVESWKLIKKSVDARDKGDVHFVMTVDVRAKNEAEILKRLNAKDVTEAPQPAAYPVPKAAFASRPVVVGAGPAGLFAAYMLAESGAAPILIERGQPVEERAQAVEKMRSEGVLDPESNVQFGEGGAGTFSDGKLTTGIKSPWQKKVLELFVQHGAPEDILYDQKPHIGTDLLRGVIRSMRESIIRMGGEVRFGTRLERLILKDGKVAGVQVMHGGELSEISTDTVLLAVGHSARDTVHNLYDQGIGMAQKPFAMGVRIEHPQALIDRSQYGRFAGHPALGPAPYKLMARTPDGRGAYTFCMCPGGYVMAASSEPGRLCVNGMSLSARDGINANAALLVGIRPEDFGGDHPLSGIALQRRLEEAAFAAGGGGFRAPVQRLEDFMNDRETKRFGDVAPSYHPGVTAADLRAVLPDFMIEDMKTGLRAMDRQLRGYLHPDAVLTAVEARSSSPVRIMRDERLMASAEGLFPVGEGAGYAGGIVSAAVDGINAALAAIEREASG